MGYDEVHGNPSRNGQVATPTEFLNPTFERAGRRVPEKHARDVIILSTWSWKTFNTPERIAIALAGSGSKVLYCEMPVSRFRQRAAPTQEIRPGVFAYAPEYWGGKFNAVGPLRDFQWKAVGKAILRQATQLQLKDPVFLYSHIRDVEPLCVTMKKAGLPLIHICMDYPEPYQYELIKLSDKTFVIPKTVFRDLRTRYGEKILWMPQSIHLPEPVSQSSGLAEMAAVPRPRLGYLGPLYGRVDLNLMQHVLEQRPDWHFVCFGGSELLPFPNVHSLPWLSPEKVADAASSLDAGIMPYDLSDPKNLHCMPLKIFDYFWAGIPVVSTRVLSLSDFEDLIYFGDTPPELIRAVEAALAEPSTSAKRAKRQAVAREHSTESLGRHLLELLAAKL